MNGSRLRAIISIAWRTLAGLVVGGILLWLALRNVDVHQVARILRFIDLRWVAAAIAIYAVALFCRMWRWWVILRATVDISLGQVAVALLAGYAVNALLPARLGELFRADYCGRRNGLSRSTVLGTIMIERFTDGLVVLGALLVGLLSLRLDAKSYSILVGVLVAGSVIFGGLGLALFALGGRVGRFIASHPFIVSRVPWAVARLEFLRSSVQMLRSWRILGVIALSLIVWFFDGAAFWAILKACGVSLDVFAMCLVVSVVSLSTLLPSPPGFVGTMQFAFALSVSFAGLPASLGIAAATANQVFLLGAMVAVGLSVLAWTSGRSLVAQGRTALARDATPSNLER